MIFGMAPKLMQHISQCSAQVGMARKPAWAKKNRPALILKVSSCNAGVFFGVNLLHSHHSKGNLTLWTFRCLGKVAIISNLAN